MDKWLCSIWLLANSKNGVSSHELGRAIGITQKSAWFVLQRIRLAMQTGTFQKFDGPVETDESFIGGRTKFVHKADRPRRIVNGQTKKSMVVGTLQRGTDEHISQVRAEVMLDTQWDSERGHVRRTVEPGSEVFTDAHNKYVALRDEYKHETVNHEDGEYVRGRVSTNAIENFWSLLKRSLKGTYISVDESHLFRYVDERAFAFNLRNLTDLERFIAVVSRVSGRRLTYAALTNAS
jgi:hypothetical protein